MELMVGARTSPELAAEVRRAIDKAIEYATTEADVGARARRGIGRCDGRRPGPLRPDLRRPRRPGGHGPSVAVTAWLIDKSALVRLAHSDDAGEWASRIDRGLVRITTVTRLEV